MNFFGIGVGEIVVILGLVFIVLGPDKIPGIARLLGKAIYTLGKYSSAVTKGFTEAIKKEVKEPPYAQNEATKKLEK